MTEADGIYDFRTSFKQVNMATRLGTKTFLMKLCQRLPIMEEGQDVVGCSTMTNVGQNRLITLFIPVTGGVAQYFSIIPPQTEPPLMLINKHSSLLIDLPILMLMAVVECMCQVGKEEGSAIAIQMSATSSK